MGLFSKIFGGDGDQQQEPQGGDASSADGATEERRRDGAMPQHRAERTSARAGAPPDTHAPAASALGSTVVVPGADMARPETPRGAARSAGRPTLSANVEARVHAQPAHGATASKRAADSHSPQPAAAAAPKRGTGDLSPSPPPAQVGPPPKPSGATSRAPVPASRAPAKKVTATATLPLGSNAAAQPSKRAENAPPKPSAENGAAPAKAAEALVLEPLAATPPPAAPPPPATDRDDVDHAFERIAPATAAARAMPGSLADDAVAKAENARLFSAMVTDHARPLREFMLDLAIGPTTKQWLDVAKPAAQSILKGALALDQQELSIALGEFVKALDRAAETAGAKISAAERGGVMSAYAKLASLLPSAFELKGDRDRREPLVVHHLLLQIPGIYKVTLDKLYAAGLASLEALCRSSAEDLVAIGRLEAENAQAIIRRFQSYWRERTEHPLQKAEERAKQKLRELVAELGRAHEEFQRAEAKEDREAKRRARAERRARALAMNVLLAQLGEVDLVEELERSPTERRISRVRSYIEGAAPNGGA